MEKEEKKISKDTLYLSALLLFTFFSFYKYLNYETIWIDGYGYMYAGYEMIHHLHITDRLMHTQAYVPSFIMGLFQLITNDYVSGKITTLLFVMIGVIVIYYIGKELKNELVGFLSSLIYISIPIVYYMATKSLVDLDLGVVYALGIYTILRYEKEPTKRNASYIGIVLALALLTKSAGLLLWIITFLYFTVKYKEKVFKNRNIYIMAIYGVALYLPVMILNLIKYRKIVLSPNGFLNILSINKSHLLFFFNKNILSLYFPWYLLILFLGGVYYLYKEKRNVFYLFFIYYFTYLVAFSIVKYQYPRFMTVLAPVIALTSAYFLGKIKIKSFKEELLLIGVVSLLIIAPMISYGTKVIEANKYKFTGFMSLEPIAMQYIPENSTLYAMSSWDMEFVLRRKDNVNIRNAPTNLNDTISALKECNVSYPGRCFFEYDIWEFSYRSKDMMDLAIHPKKYNLTLIYAVPRSVLTSEGTTIMPVVMLYRYG